MSVWVQGHLHDHLFLCESVHVYVYLCMFMYVCMCMYICVCLCVWKSLYLSPGGEDAV